MYLLIVMLFVAILPAAAFGTPTAQQSGNFNVSVAGTAVGSIPHQIDLKITQLPGGQLSEVSGFIVNPEDVVQVKQGENLIVSTSPDLTTHQVTVRNIQGIPVDLVPLPSNAWSLQGLLPGVYTLDVNVAMSSSGFLGMYETILAILEPNQQPLPPTTIISQITVEESKVCPPNLILVNGNCTEPKPPSPSPKPTDDCNDPSTPRTMCPFGPFWNEEEKEPQTCTPDGPPCPPCPEGVEAGWCADDDEQDDIDECLINDCTVEEDESDQDLEETDTEEEDISAEFSGDENDEPEVESESESEGSDADLG